MNRIVMLLLFVCSSFPSFAKVELDSLLKELDLAIQNRQSYTDIKQARINSLKELLHKSGNSNEQTYNINLQLFKEYEAFVSDSALYYTEQNYDYAQTVKNNLWIDESKLHLSSALSSMAMYKDAIELLNSIDKAKLPEALLKHYYACYKYAYSEFGYYSGNTRYASEYEQTSKLYRDSLLTMLTPGTDAYLEIEEILLQEQGKMKESLDINTRRLAKLSTGTRIYAKTTHQRSEIYQREGNREAQKKYLILSAIADIQAAVKDNISLYKLSNLYYEDGEIDRAYRYGKISMEDANFYNARLRKIQISLTQSMIEKNYQIKSEEQKDNLELFLTCISLLSLLLILAVGYIYKQMKSQARTRNELQHANVQLDELNKSLQQVNTRQQELNNQLSEANRIKEEYISLFLSLCSTYIDKLENYRKMVNRKVAAGQIDELFKATKSAQSTDMELKEFYTRFDNTFLHLYPHFVEEFNTLLLPGEKIELKNGELLTTELRIFALIRLGITDSSRIAEFLRYSVNTIYTYRTKVKNKAILPRDDFENAVMQIGVFNP